MSTPLWQAMHAMHTLVPTAVLLFFSPLDWAYEAPLASRSVREAYFLGQRNDL